MVNRVTTRRFSFLFQDIRVQLPAGVLRNCLLMTGKNSGD
jgi:hypothetical protein